MGIVVLLVVLAVLYGIYRAIPALSKPWRVKVTNHGRGYSDTVSVILAKRFTTGQMASDRIMIKPDVRVRGDDLEDELKNAVQDAKRRAKALSNAHKVKS